jgi:hypothetical protein
MQFLRAHAGIGVVQHIPNPSNVNRAGLRTYSASDDESLYSKHVGFPIIF